MEETIRPKVPFLAHHTKKQTVEMLAELKGFLKKHRNTVIPVSAVAK